jgi:cytochrome c oxidase subunit 4
VDADALEDVRKSVRTYYAIFAALMILTVVTVAVSYLHLPMPLAILLALAVASVKGALVALYFMHLLHERKVVYWLLGLTLAFFAFLMIVPLITNLDKVNGTLMGVWW